MIVRFEIPDEHIERIQVALGARLALGRSATGAEVREFICAAVIDAVHEHEMREARRAVASPDRIDFRAID